MPYKNAGDLRNSLPTSESYFHPETLYFIFCIQNAIDTTYTYEIRKKDTADARWPMAGCGAAAHAVGLY